MMNIAFEDNKIQIYERSVHLIIDNAILCDHNQIRPY